MPGKHYEQRSILNIPSIKILYTTKKEYMRTRKLNNNKIFKKLEELKTKNENEKIEIKQYYDELIRIKTTT